jgi:hypothetical protein
MRVKMRWVAVFAAWLFVAGHAAAQTDLKTRNVVLIVCDGLRWQEVFLGPEPALMNKPYGGVLDIAALRKDFLRENSAKGRETLLPFFWSVIAQQGQLFGNLTKDSVARVTNGLKFSYPGYNEMLTGHADPRVDSNDPRPNPNVTMFEWLAGLPEFRGRVAAFATWGVFDAIFNRERSGFYIFSGWEPHAARAATPRQALLDELYRTTTRIWSDNANDSLMHAAMKEYVQAERPRLLFVGYGETDEWAHDGRYDLVLRSAHQFDAFVADLWSLLQSMPEYRDQTTFIITTDHGRGSGLEKWRNHGRKVAGAENFWLAVLGPDTSALGERTKSAPITQSQIAATIAALLGQDFLSATPAAAPPIAEVVGKAH